MKKIILTCLVALAAIVSVSAANSQQKSSEFTYPYALFLSDCKATVEYNVPNIISGSIELKNFEKIYRLLRDFVANIDTKTLYNRNFL